MTIPTIESVQSAEQARTLAIDWQHWQSEQSLSWGETGDWSAFFEQLGEKYGLLEEFKENGIC